MLSEPSAPRGSGSIGGGDDVDNGVWNLLKMDEEIAKPTQWCLVNSNTFKSFQVTHKRIPPGCYSVTLDNRDEKPLFVKKIIKNDTILRFKNDLIDKLLKEINEFWGKGEVFKTNGFLHRRGYLLYGPQGTGKSSAVWQISQDVINRGGVVFVCDNPSFFKDGLKNFRQAEPERPIVCVFEDIDAIINKYGDPILLSILDGDNQVDRVINIATTNYPELLDKRIVSRPRRFDRVFKILAPEDKIRMAFLKEKLPKTEDPKEWTKKTEGLSFAAISEALISVLCLDNKLDDVIAILKDLENKKISSSDFKDNSGLGFSGGGNTSETSLTNR